MQGVEGVENARCVASRIDDEALTAHVVSDDDAIRLERTDSQHLEHAWHQRILADGRAYCWQDETVS